MDGLGELMTHRQKVVSPQPAVSLLFGCPEDRLGIAGGDQMLDKANGNWVKISREVFYHELADDKPWSRLATWIFLVAMASTGERTVQFRGHEYSLTRGQLSISLGDLEEKTGWSRGRVRCFFSYLKRKQMANTSGDPFCTLVTILNYDKWQGTNCQAVIGKKNDIASSIANDIASSIANDSIEAVGGCTNNIVHDIASDIANSQQNKNVVKEVLKKSTLEDMSCKPSKVTKKSDGFLGNAYVVLSYLNDKAHHQYQQSPSSVIEILKRLKAGATVSDLELIIDYKVYEWVSTPLAKNLNNETLFRDCHYANYLEAARAWDIKRQTGANSLMMEEKPTTMTDEERKKAKAALFEGFGDGPDGDDPISLEDGHGL